MLVSNNNARFLNEDLSSVLTAFYSAEELRSIALDLVFPFVGVAPPERKLLKADLISIVTPLIEKPELFLPFFRSFPKPLQSVLTFLTWEGDCPLDVIETAMGFPLATRRTVKPLYSHHRDILEVSRLSAFCFVGLEVFQPPYYYEQVEATITARLPRAIRSLLCQALPEKPYGFEIEPVADDKIQASHRFSCQREMVGHLQRLADLVDKKHLKLTQNGQPSKASLRQANAFMANREFFPPTKEQSKLELIRTSMILSLVRALPKGFRDDLAHGRVKPTHLRMLMDFVEEHPQWVFDNLLLHLFTREHRINPVMDNWLGFQEFIRNLPVGSWVTWENITRHHRFQGLNFCFCYNSGVGTRMDSASLSSRRYYGDVVPLTRENATELVELPLIRGFAFLLASLGFAEIAYTLPPDHKGAWMPRNNPYLTPFDGLQAIRITPEGAYAFGFDQEIQLAAVDDARSRITLNPNCLNAICHDVDPVTELSLLQFMEKISPGHYRMTRNSFLHGCRNKSDATTRLAAFKDTVGDTIPPLWETFLQETISTCMALKQISGYRIYQLEQDPELRGLFGSDPTLRSHCIRAEGFKVLIKNDALPIVQKYLKTLGYLLQ